MVYALHADRVPGPVQALQTVNGVQQSVKYTRPDYCSAYNYTPGHLVAAPGVTHIFYAFAAIDPTTYEVITYEYNDDKLMAELNGLKKGNSALKTLISIGGWSFSQVRTRYTHTIHIHSAVSGYAAL